MGLCIAKQEIRATTQLVAHTRYTNIRKEKMSMKKKTRKKLPSISEVKKTLMENWKLRVKQRDGWECVLCGATELLNAHHWYASDRSGHMSRYCVDNGVTLCYACHLRKVHTRADYRTINHIYRHMLDNYKSDTTLIESLVSEPVTVPGLRALWDNFRSNIIECSALNILLQKKGTKHFLVQPMRVNNRQLFVKNQLVVFEKVCYEVTVVAKTKTGQFRYTIKEMEEEDE